MKSGVFVKLPEITARYLHLKLKHLEEIITFYLLIKSDKLQIGC
jgi:hypothetical protein